MNRHVILGISALLFYTFFSGIGPGTVSAQENGIFFPRANGSLRGVIEVSGTAAHPTFRKWQLDLLIDGDPEQATFLAVGEEPIAQQEVFETINTALYPDGEHLLRLRVVHSNLNYDEFVQPITINNAGLLRPKKVSPAAEASKNETSNDEASVEKPTETSTANMPESVGARNDGNPSTATPRQASANSHTLATRLDLPFDKSGRWIEVDLATQTLRAWDADRLYLETFISSGEAWTPTVQGVFQVERKTPSQRMVGPDYDLPNVKSVMYFFSNYAIHGAYWHTDFGERASHGCVNMREDEASLLYDWASIGTPVFVYE